MLFVIADDHDEAAAVLKYTTYLAAPATAFHSARIPFDLFESVTAGCVILRISFDGDHAP